MSPALALNYRRSDHRKGPWYAAQVLKQKIMKEKNCPSLEMLRKLPFFFFNVDKQKFYETTENELSMLHSVKASELFPGKGNFSCGFFTLSNV